LTGESIGLSWATSAITGIAGMVCGNSASMLGKAFASITPLQDSEVVLLLCGGDKRTQDADINRACEYWLEWRGRNQE